MATTKSIQNIFPGTVEYMARFTPATTNDDLKMEFNGQVVIDDIIVDLGDNADLTYNVNLLYPMSGRSLPIEEGATSDYTLNKDNWGRHLWFSVPERTSLQVKVTGLTTADDIDVVVVGRSIGF